MFSWFRKNDNPKQRTMGSAANALMQASQHYQGFAKIGEVLHLEGPHVSLEALSISVGHLQRRHPVLRSRLQINPEKPNIYLLEEDDTLQLKIQEISRKRADHLTSWRREWREREKETVIMGQGVAEFWLLQDPDDENEENSPREIVCICEHSVCDGLSLSTVAHELLIALAGDYQNMFANSLDWPLTMETAIHRTMSSVNKLTTLIRFIVYALYLHMSNTWFTSKIPLTSVDFPLVDMTNYCHTELSYGSLDKDVTQKLVEKCRREGVTVTSAVNSAMLCAISTLVSHSDDQRTVLQFSIGADTRRRCIPPVPNHDLSYQVSCIMPFTMPTRDIPTDCEGMWQLARTFGQHVKTSVDANQILAIGMILGKLYQKMIGPPDSPILPTCGNSSWGILPFREQYGRWQLIGMKPLMNMVRGTTPFTMIQTVNGVLTIMFAGNDPVLPLKTIDNLRDGTMQKLRQMIAD